jgi:predicted O-methyltransferase YrrM
LNDEAIANVPLVYEKIKEAADELQFDMASDLQTGSLLKTLAASKPGGRFLELGTGTGLATAWIAEGMDDNSSLISFENNSLFVDVAKKHIKDKRVEFILADGYEWILDSKGKEFDLIFADAMPGKYDLFEETIAMLSDGGFYIVDDMLPQPTWPLGHDNRVIELINKLETRTDLLITKLNWSTGIIITVKK